MQQNIHSDKELSLKDDTRVSGILGAADPIDRCIREPTMLAPSDSDCGQCMILQLNCILCFVNRVILLLSLLILLLCEYYNNCYFQQRRKTKQKTIPLLLIWALKCPSSTVFSLL